MNISINNLLTIAAPTARGNAAHSRSKGPAAAENFSLLLSSETNPKTKTDKKPPVDTANQTGDTTELQPNITQPTANNTSEQNPKINPPQTQQEDSDTQLSTAVPEVPEPAYSMLTQNASQPVETPLIPEQGNLTNNAAPAQPAMTGLPDIKPPAEITSQGNPQTMQNSDETTIDTEQANQSTENQKIKPFQQNPDPVEDSAVSESDNQQIPNTEDQKTQKTAIIPDLPMTAEPLKAAQTSNESAEGGAEKEADKTSQSKNKLQSADGGQNQQTNALISSNTIPNKTETLLPDDHNPPMADQIHQTLEKDSGGNESASRQGWLTPFGTLSNNQPAQNGQKIPSSQNISNDFKLPPDLSGQIQESARAFLTSNKNQVTIRLNPPELGSVCLKVSDNGHQITGLLQITKPETKYEIQQLLPGIIRSLEDAGISVKSFDVVLNNQPDQQTLQQSLYQQNDQNSYIPYRDNTADYQTFNYSLNNENGLQAISSSQRIAASAGSLNILM